MPSFRSIKLSSHSYSSPPCPEEPSAPPPPPPPPRAPCSPCQHKNHTHPPPGSAPPPPPPPTTTTPPPPTPPPPATTPAPPPTTATPPASPPPPRASPLPFYNPAAAIAPPPYFLQSPTSQQSIAPLSAAGNQHQPQLVGISLGGLFFLSFLALGINYIFGKKFFVSATAGTTSALPPPINDAATVATMTATQPLMPTTVTHPPSNVTDAHAPEQRPTQQEDHRKAEQEDEQSEKKKRKKVKADTVVQSLKETGMLLTALLAASPSHKDKGETSYAVNNTDNDQLKENADGGNPDEDDGDEDAVANDTPEIEHDKTVSGDALIAAEKLAPSTKPPRGGRGAQSSSSRYPKDVEKFQTDSSQQYFDENDENADQGGGEEEGDDNLSQQHFVENEDKVDQEGGVEEGDDNLDKPKDDVGVGGDDDVNNGRRVGAVGGRGRGQGRGQGRGRGRGNSRNRKISSTLNLVNKSEKQIYEKSAEKNGEETKLEEGERQGTSGNDMNKKSDEEDDEESEGDDEKDDSLVEELGDLDILGLANLGPGLFKRWSSVVEKLVKRNTRLVYQLQKMINERENNSPADEMRQEPSVKRSDVAPSGKQGKTMSGALNGNDGRKGKRVMTRVADKDISRFEGEGGGEEDDAERGDVEDVEKEEYPTECGEVETVSPIPDDEEEVEKTNDEDVAKERMRDEDEGKATIKEMRPVDHESFVKKNKKPGQRGVKAVSGKEQEMKLGKDDNVLSLLGGSDEANSRERDQLNVAGVFDGDDETNEQEEMMNDEEGGEGEGEEEGGGGGAAADEKGVEQGMEKMPPVNYDLLSKNRKAKKKKAKKMSGKEQEMRLVNENDPLSLLKGRDEPNNRKRDQLNVAGVFDNDEGTNEQVEEDYAMGDHEEEELPNYESLIDPKNIKAMSSVYPKSDMPQNIKLGRKQQAKTTSSALSTVSHGMAALKETGDYSHGQVTLSSIIGTYEHKTGENARHSPKTVRRSNITSKRGADVARHETVDAADEDVEQEKNTVDDTGMSRFADPGEGEEDDESRKVESGDVEEDGKDENLTEAKNMVAGRHAPLGPVDERLSDEYSNKENKGVGKLYPKTRSQGDISAVGALVKMGVDDYDLLEKGIEEEVNEDEADEEKLNLAAGLQVIPAVDHVSLEKKKMMPGVKAISGMFDEATKKKNLSKSRRGQGEQAKEGMGGALVNKVVDNKNMIISMAEENQTGNEKSCDLVERLNDEENEETEHGMGEMPFDSLSALAKNIEDGKQQHLQERCNKTVKNGRKHAKDGRGSSISNKKGAAQPQCEDHIGDKLQPPNTEGDSAKDEQDVGADAAAEYDTTEAAADDDDGAGQCGTTTQEDSLYSVQA
ncbi:uncharacterized protein LOC125209227 [Salvia hispanica]|uniref:uncharacterized protein LOC125209227 n=1 Tax=Salvia hispanica TaxID=49212 RepID=UPI002009598D|nr:uncharacterized protein LOC125209227 [Salvia hispanica]